MRGRRYDTIISNKLSRWELKCEINSYGIGNVDHMYGRFCTGCVSERQVGSGVVLQLAAAQAVDHGDHLRVLAQLVLAFLQSGF